MGDATQTSRSNTFSVVFRCFELLSPRDKLKLLSIVAIQVALVLLDLVGVLLIGAVASIGVSAIRGTSFSSWLQTLISTIGLNQESPQTIATVLGICAGLALIFKSILSFYLNLKIFGFLARREALISSTLAEKIFSSPLVELGKYSTSEIQYVLTAGSNFATVGVLGQSSSLLAEIFLQIAMLFTLFIYSPTLMLGTFLFFGGILLILNFSLGKRASSYGQELALLSMNVNKGIADAMGSYREIQVMDRRAFFVRRIIDSKVNLAEKGIRQAMLSQVSKYVFETSIVLAGLFIAAFAFLSRDAINAVELVAVFIAASSRIAPSVMKIQVGWINLKGAIGGTFKFFDMFMNLSTLQPFASLKAHSELLLTANDQNLLMSLKNLDFHYPNQNELKVIDNVNLNIPSHGLIAIVGPSGAGKSTLVDLILGVHTPTSGKIVKYSMKNEKNSSKLSLGYVPQDVFLTAGTILENVCFGIEREFWDIENAKRCLETVGLEYLINSSGEVVDKILGERGSGLSGGQRQRIGIARAIYSRPDILVLDEATSSLDAESEFLISNAIDLISKNSTVIVIAHRLSTVRRADQISYMEMGKIIATDKFDALREKIPNFDRQADLMGIKK